MSSDYNYTLFPYTTLFRSPINFKGTIAPAATALAFTCNPSTGPVKVGVAYSATCTITGGTAPYKINYSALPAIGRTHVCTPATQRTSMTSTAGKKKNNPVF